MTPSVVDLPDMPLGQKATFEAITVSSTVDIEGIGKQDSLWTIWRLTPGVLEGEAKDKAVQEAQQIALQAAEKKVKQKDSRNFHPA